MDKDLFHLMACRQLQAGVQVALVGVDPAGADQPAKMQLALIALDMLHCLEQRRILKEGTIMDGSGDAGILLKHTLPRADIEMAHLRVAHLPLWQSNSRTTGCNARMRKGTR